MESLIAAQQELFGRIARALDNLKRLAQPSYQGR